MKLRVQAQHLQPGDIVGSGEVINRIVISSIYWPSNKIYVRTNKREAHWGKYTMINVEREEK